MDTGFTVNNHGLKEYFNWLLRSGVMCACDCERLIGYQSNLCRSSVLCLLSHLRRVLTGVNCAMAGQFYSRPLSLMKQESVIHLGLFFTKINYCTLFSML